MSAFLLSVLMFAAGAVTLAVIYRIRHNKVNETKAEKPHKITIRVIAAGSTAAWLIMQVPYAKETLDVVYYNRHLDFYIPINIALFLLMIISGIITGGTYLTNIKGNAGS
jgi:predicted membrane protein